MTEHDDYLWDRSGKPDPEIEALERQLAAFALDRWMRPRRRPAPARLRALGLALAATLAVGAVGLGAWLSYRLLWPEGTAWAVVASHDARTDRGGAPTTLAPGDVLVTGAAGWARVHVARIGELHLEPSSRLELQSTGTGQHRVRLVEGQLWARIWAPPQQFGVALPGGELWDLGCEFRVQTDREGRGWLRVDSGWVLLEREGIEVLVPQGTQVAMHDGRIVGTPHAQDAGAPFRRALHALDARGDTIAADDPALVRLAALARPADAITLLSLMQRQPALADSLLFDRFQALLPAARDLRREAFRQRDSVTLDRAWAALPYPRTKAWWWHWRDGLPELTGGAPQPAG